VIEEDEEKRGRGKGSPHFYAIKQREFARAGFGNVFPITADVEAFIQSNKTNEKTLAQSNEEGGGGRTRRTRSQPIHSSGVSCSSGQRSQNEQEHSDKSNGVGETEASCSFWER
jgi:hypothetical protein